MGGYNKKESQVPTVWSTVWGNWKPRSLLVERAMCHHFGKSREGPQMIKCCINSTPRLYPEERNTYTHENVHSDVYSSIRFNKPRCESDSMSTSRQANKQNAVCPHTGPLAQKGHALRWVMALMDLKTLCQGRDARLRKSRVYHAAPVL